MQHCMGSGAEVGAGSETLMIGQETRFGGSVGGIVLVMLLQCLSFTHGSLVNQKSEAPRRDTGYLEGYQCTQDLSLLYCKENEGRLN